MSATITKTDIENAVKAAVEASASSYNTPLSTTMNIVSLRAAETYATTVARSLKTYVTVVVRSLSEKYAFDFDEALNYVGVTYVGSNKVNIEVKTRDYNNVEEIKTESGNKTESAGNKTESGNKTDSDTESETETDNKKKKGTKSSKAKKNDVENVKAKKSKSKNKENDKSSSLSSDNDDDEKTDNNTAAATAKKIFFPFICVNESKCQAIKRNEGLFTQCETAKQAGKTLCKKCDNAFIKTQKMPFGTTLDRIKDVHAETYLEYKVTNYAKFMGLKNITDEQFFEHAASVGIEHSTALEYLNASKASLSETKRGRPKTEKKKVVSKSSVVVAAPAQETSDAKDSSVAKDTSDAKDNKETKAKTKGSSSSKKQKSAAVCDDIIAGLVAKANMGKNTNDDKNKKEEEVKQLAVDNKKENNKKDKNKESDKSDKQTKNKVEEEKVEIQTQPVQVKQDHVQVKQEQVKQDHEEVVLHKEEKQGEKEILDLDFGEELQEEKEVVDEEVVEEEVVEEIIDGVKYLVSASGDVYDETETCIGTISNGVITFHK